NMSFESTGVDLTAQSVRPASSPRLARLRPGVENGRLTTDGRRPLECASPCMRIAAHRSPKQAAQSGLIDQAAGDRDLTQWLVGRQHQLLRAYRSSHRQIRVRRLAKAFLECPGKVTGAEIDHARKIGCRQ